MDTTTITALLVLLALALLGAMAFTQARYKAKKANREKLLHLSTENKKLQALLRSLPGDYLSIELRDFIYRTLIMNMNQMMELDKSNSKFIQDDLDQIVELRRALHTTTSGKESDKPVTNIEQANAARAGLKALYQYIKTAFEHRQLTRPEAQSLLDEIEHRLVKTAADFYTARAEMAQKQKRFKEAMSLWRKVTETYSNSRLASQYQKPSMEAQAKMRQMQAEWKEANRERNEQQAKVMQEKLGQWAEEQDDWKKKHLYDE